MASYPKLAGKIIKKYRTCMHNGDDAFRLVNFTNFILITITDLYLTPLLPSCFYPKNTKKKICEDVMNIILPAELTYNNNKLYLTFYKNFISYVNIYDPVKYNEFIDYIDKNYDEQANTIYIDNSCENCKIIYISASMYPLSNELKSIPKYIHNSLKYIGYISSEEMISIRDLACVPDTKPARIIPLI